MSTSDDDLIARLASHRTLRAAPHSELEWLVAHGTLERFAHGTLVAHKGAPVVALFIVLAGRISHLSDQGGTWRRVMGWQGGDVTGQLPYSRMSTSPGNSIVEEDAEVFTIGREQLPDMVVACPHVTAALVHVMVDRARAFTSSDLQLEKMASLGKLAAGLAHELNNPASAAVRSAQRISEALAEADEAARALGGAGLDDNERSLIERARAECLDTPTTKVLSPVERADREEWIAEWLVAHDVDESFADGLGETGVSRETLNQLATALSGHRLDAALRWMASSCTVRALAHDIERAASRVHTLVSAVKGFTYMDHATTPEPVDIGRGLSDTIAVLGAKARGKSASVTVDVSPDLPRARGFGGELNQVWANLVDNALDAIPDGGHVSVTARAEGPRVVVRVVDSGPGIPNDVKSRIFDPFFTTKPVGKGTGLGLDIVRRLVDRNDGLIDVESSPGRTEFRVSLPTLE